MARMVHEKDISKTLAAATRWIERCLVGDRSLFSEEDLWLPRLLQELVEGFVDRPDYGDDSFMTKLKRQVACTSPGARQLMGELLWALLLFPSNMSAVTKKRQIVDMAATAEVQFPSSHPLLADEVLRGIGSGGPGFNNYRDRELAFLIAICIDLKKRSEADRRRILTEYDVFCVWMDTVPQPGRRQYRHMLRFFCFPDRVERISSNNDRFKILEAFGVAKERETKEWSDQALDEAVLGVRQRFEQESPGKVFDFYRAEVKQHWSPERKVKTLDGELTVAVPEDEEEQGEEANHPAVERQSIQMQAGIARIGAMMGFKIWVPRADRQRVLGQIAADDASRAAFIDELPLGYDSTTLATIRLIDVLWVSGRSIERAFEVEHTTAVYSGLLRMADLLALVPNMDIKLHIVAPDERRDKVFHEMKRPVFTLLARGPLSRRCSFISYESIDAIAGIPHLAHTNPTVVDEYAENAEE